MPSPADKERPFVVRNAGRESSRKSHPPPVVSEASFHTSPVDAMLYELIAVVRPGSLNEVREIARNAGIQVLRSGGVVRGYTNWGTFRLPKPTTKHQARYTDGHHFIMRFDASGPVQSAVRRTLGLDPRMIRFSVVKLGDKLEDIKDVEGKVEWTNVRKIADSI
ncbi:mitochondrial 37S ribosomal protein bS6m [Aspergillus clavatus NRRL 1]|uniref:Small ribosomal subunit protein bS6m n=1 Tax=Aspergillus clavatus (strain ATCC 1007 / CBS 513.65 / DSM 816 / NCTC 3887 / NRRL 1 / QM 1276 / 107) TaxID=344612 RepID=A1CPR5_ASPCL|nr:mitochondrial 37S ribosomal protein YmS16 [Aspergillus clavatus NRRL 1]EAW07636.1 37S ribosomal protein Mrp17 [Aspergillus clavatus NRRL 1]